MPGIFHFKKGKISPVVSNRPQTDENKIKKVNTALQKIDKFFHDIEPSLKNGISRDEYCEQHPEIKDCQNCNFSLTADEIIKHKIPYKVAGCTGRAKLFSKFARDIGLTDFFVVPAFVTDDIERKGQINGHGLIAIQLSYGLFLIDPMKGKTFETARIKGKCVVDEKIDASGNGKKDYTIAAILTPYEYDKINSYAKMKKIFLGCKTAKKILLNKATKELNKKMTTHKIAHIENQYQNG